MSVDEQAVLHGIPAFAFEGGFEDDGKGEADGLEEQRQRDGGAEGVEEEGCGGAFDAEGYETRWIDQGGN